MKNKFKSDGVSPATNILSSLASCHSAMVARSRQKNLCSFLVIHKVIFHKWYKKPLTLIELLIAITLIILATSAMGWKMAGMIAKKRFNSSVEKLRSRLLTCRRLAMNMQSDWRGELSIGKEAQFSTQCVDDARVFPMPTIMLGPIQCSLNGQERNKIFFDFTSSGDIRPHGQIEIRSGHLNPVKWDLIELFSLEEGLKAGPSHPSH